MPSKVRSDRSWKAYEYFILFMYTQPAKPGENKLE